MRYGSSSSRQRPHDAASSSRAPSVERATRVLAARYGLNPKTVDKWRGRTTTVDQPMGPTQARSTVLTEAEETIVPGSSPRTFVQASNPHEPDREGRDRVVHYPDLESLKAHTS